MRPPFRYLGSKQRMVPVLKRLLPDKVDFYMEPFFGSGAVLLSRYPAKCEVVNDIDGRIVNFFRVLRERPDELVAALRLTPWARDEWQACKEPTDDPLEAARRFCVLSWQGLYSSGDKGSWNNGILSRQASNYCAGFHRRLAFYDKIRARMLHVLVDNKCGIEFIRAHNKRNLHGDLLVYLDPPYPAGTRETDGERVYASDELDHEDLLRAALEWNGMCAISTYDNDLYSDVLGGAGWNREGAEFHLVNGTDSVKRTEVVWRNFTLQARLL